jgi:hypothetical protein
MQWHSYIYSLFFTESENTSLKYNTIEGLKKKQQMKINQGLIVPI